MIQGLTRRAVLSLLAAPLGTAFQSRSEFAQFTDEVTEVPVVRLTGLSSSSFLPASGNRSVSVKGKFLVFSSDRGGPLAPFRLDLKTGAITALAPASAMQASSLSIDPAGRTALFLDGQALKQISTAGKHLQVVQEPASAFSLGSTAAEIVFVKRGKLCRLGESREIADSVGDWCQWRPGGTGCLFRRTDDLWYVSFADPGKARCLAQGNVSGPRWSADGRTVYYLRGNALIEASPEASEEKQLASTSQFASFSANADGSVFVGASRSKAQPTINLLLRATRREFTLCEHRASHPEACAPVFSSDSHRLYFNSDFQGKPAIYSVNVEALIEETNS